MCRFIASRFASILIFGCLGLALVTSPLRAQNLRQWMPNVGDRFHYRQNIQAAMYENGHVIGGNNSTTAATEIILSDTIIDSTHSVIIALMDDAPLQRFQLTDTTDTGGKLPLIIWGFNGFMDFTRSQEYQMNFGSKIITCFAGIGGISVAPVYTPDFKWFYSRSIEFGTLSGEGFKLAGTDTIIDCYLTSVEQAGVSKNSESINQFIEILTIRNGLLSVLVTCSDLSLHFSLLDPLGRSVSNWQFPATSGSREISLNVADVPSGVYFLRISGDGMDEVKKVCITH